MDFPAYVIASDSFDNGGWYERYMRIDADGTVRSIEEHDDHWKFKTESEGMRADFFDESSTYYRRSTREDYELAYERAMKALEKMVR